LARTAYLIRSMWLDLQPVLLPRAGNLPDTNPRKTVTPAWEGRPTP
jgi:hypothetical protein